MQPTGSHKITLQRPVLGQKFNQSQFTNKCLTLSNQTMGYLYISGLYSKHVPIVPVLVESWSGQLNSGPW